MHRCGETFRVEDRRRGEVDDALDAIFEGAFDQAADRADVLARDPAGFAGGDGERDGGGGVTSVGTGRGSRSSGLTVAQIVVVVRRRERAVVVRLRWPSSN